MATTPRPRYKMYGVQITRPSGRVHLQIPVANWTDDHATIMKRIERELVELFKVKK